MFRGFCAICNNKPLNFRFEKSNNVLLQKEFEVGTLYLQHIVKYFGHTAGCQKLSWSTEWM